MTYPNRKLLLSAARACGFTLGYSTGLWIREDTGEYWNPLESYRDCAAMETQLRINLSWSPTSVSAETTRHTQHLGQCIFTKEEDAGRARVMASLLCAAYVGAEIAALENDPPDIEEADMNPNEEADRLIVINDVLNQMDELTPASDAVEEGRSPDEYLKLISGVCAGSGDCRKRLVLIAATAIRGAEVYDQDTRDYGGEDE